MSRKIGFDFVLLVLMSLPFPYLLDNGGNSDLPLYYWFIVLCAYFDIDLLLNIISRGKRKEGPMIRLLEQDAPTNPILGFLGGLFLLFVMAIYFLVSPLLVIAFYLYAPFLVAVAFLIAAFVSFRQTVVKTLLFFVNKEKYLLFRFGNEGLKEAYGDKWRDIVKTKLEQVSLSALAGEISRNIKGIHFYPLWDYPIEKEVELTEWQKESGDLAPDLSYYDEEDEGEDPRSEDVAEGFIKDEEKKSPVQNIGISTDIKKSCCKHENVAQIPVFEVGGEPRRVLRKCLDCGEVLETTQIGR